MSSQLKAVSSSNTAGLSENLRHIKMYRTVVSPTPLLDQNSLLACRNLISQVSNNDVHFVNSNNVWTIQTPHGKRGNKIGGSSVSKSKTRNNTLILSTSNYDQIDYNVLVSVNGMNVRYLLLFKSDKCVWDAPESLWRLHDDPTTADQEHMLLYPHHNDISTSAYNITNADIRFSTQVLRAQSTYVISRIAEWTFECVVEMHINPLIRVQMEDKETDNCDLNFDDNKRINANKLLLICSCLEACIYDINSAEDSITANGIYASLPNYETVDELLEDLSPCELNCLMKSICIMQDTSSEPEEILLCSSIISGIGNRMVRNCEALFLFYNNIYCE